MENHISDGKVLIKRMKIAHILNDLGPGGAEKLLTDILPELKNRGHEVILILLDSKLNFKKYYDLLSNNDITIISLNKHRYNPLIIFSLYRLQVKNKFNIWHCHLFPSQMWISLATFFFPKYVRIIKTEHAVYNNRMRLKFLKYLDKLIYSRYHRIICISSDVRDMVINWTKTTPKKLIIIENGVNIKQIYNSKLSNSLLHYDQENYNILMVARFDGRQKDQISLINSIPKLDKNVHLYFAGDGPHRVRCQELVDRLNLSDRVHFLGLRDDVYAIMKSMDLNILITNFEGLSGVVLESLAAGKPFLGSDVSGVKEVVPSPEFLIKSNHPDDIALAITNLMHDEVSKKNQVLMSKEFVKKFDFIYSVNEIEKLYCNVQ